MGEITVDPKGVIKLLNNLNIHKAPGPDGLSARVLNECSSEIAPVLTYVFNESLAQGAVPDDWRQANVAPVFKKAEKQGHIRHVDRLFDEVTELLEQMELEIKDLPGKDKQKYRTRLTSYKSELTRLQADLKRAKLGLNAREELLGEEGNDSEDQRARLLDNTEKLERGSRSLEHGYRVVLETEQMGAQMLNDLHDQRETIQRSRGRLQETNANLGKSSRVLSGMLKRIIQNRILLVAICFFIILVIGLTIYFTVRKKT